ncbi:MAG: tetratricopeptide repeat protein [Polyangiaceae bacterium]
MAYLCGALFVGCAVLTEAVSGIVGIADVLGGLGAMLALLALTLPGWAMPVGVFAAITFALFSKESGLVLVPPVPVAALLASPTLHPGSAPPASPAHWPPSSPPPPPSSSTSSLRKRWFLPAPCRAPGGPPPRLPREAPCARLLVWFHYRPSPGRTHSTTPAKAPTDLRIAGALRVYARGVGQVLFPKTLSGDYSFPQEPVPEQTIFPESVLGALLMVVPLTAALAFWILALFRERRARKAAASASAAAAGAPAAEAAPDLALSNEGERALRAAAADAGAPAAADAGAPATDSTSAPPASSRTLLPRPWMRGLGLALVAISVLAFAVEAFWLHLGQRGFVWNFPIPFWISNAGKLSRYWHAVPWPYAFLPFGAIGLGLFAEGARPLPVPERATAPVPLARSGLVLAAIGFVWMVVSYFPHSNIPVILPTVRAERFWYFPAFGTALVLAVAFSWAHERLRARGLPRVVPYVFLAFFGFQCVQAYRHAADYRNDLVFWEATKEAVPNSAKAHLNFSVMKGARGDLETRLIESREAMRLAPEWPMAHIYTGDTLCRLHRPEEAWPHYKEGFAIGPNEQSLISLALQCLWDEKHLKAHEQELRELADAHPGSWIAYLAIDTLDNGEKHNGVDPKYRPRGYNEGPKD